LQSVDLITLPSSAHVRKLKIMRAQRSNKKLDF
jgi:hypothetical protein